MATRSELDAAAAQFCEAMRVRAQNATTIQHKESALKRFSRWCAERGITRAPDVTRPEVERYQRWLFNYRRQDTGAALSIPTQVNHLTALKLFFRWLVKQGLMLHNPAADLELPRLPQRLPRHVLTIEEVEAVLAQPDIHDPRGLRDRAAMEVLYSTGIRRSELVRLKVQDVDETRGTVMVRQGKGRKDRVVPIGDRAQMWLRKYAEQVRPEFVRPGDEGFLFLAQDGKPLHKVTLTARVKRYVQAAATGKEGACHLLRHTAATLMLEGGADVRYVQQFLGHRKLETTQIYTQVSIKKLKEVHDATHPGATLAGPPSKP